MEYTAKIVGQTGTGPRIEVQNEKNQKVSPSKQPGEWLGAVTASQVLESEDSRQRVEVMFQMGKELDETYGPRHENDKA